MKRILFSSVLVATLGFLLTGCLKDKGFDDYRYGINDPDTQPPGVGFAKGTRAKNTVGLNVSATTQTINDIVYVNLNAGNPAPSDITVTLTNTSAALVAAYNTANGTNIQVLDPAAYNVPLTLTIPAGQRNIQVPITVPTTMTLDPTKSFGIGLTISSVTGNYQVAENQKNLFVELTIKNKHDGKYRLTGYHNRVPYTFPYDVEIHMVTEGPNSVAFYWPEVAEFGHPIGIGPGVTNWYGTAVRPVVVFDPTTNLVTDVYNNDAAVVITMFTGAGSRLSHWDPSDRSMVVDWNYNNNALRAFFDDLEYLGPRP